MQTTHAASQERRGSSIGTRHRLEGLSILLDGGPLNLDYTQHTVADMLEVFETTVAGFDFLATPESEHARLWSREQVDEVKHALHFERIFGGKEKAERISRGLAKALKGYRDAMAAYDTPKFVFDTPEIEAEACEAIRHLAEMAWHVPVLPRDYGFEEFFN